MKVHKEFALIEKFQPEIFSTVLLLYAVASLFRDIQGQKGAGALLASRYFLAGFSF